MENELSKNSAWLQREARVDMKMVKTPHVRAIMFRGRRHGSCALQENANQTCGFCGNFKSDGVGRGCAVQEAFPSKTLGGQGVDLLRRVAFLSSRSSNLLK